MFAQYDENIISNGIIDALLNNISLSHIYGDKIHVVYFSTEL